MKPRHPLQRMREGRQPAAGGSRAGSPSSRSPWARLVIGGAGLGLALSDAGAAAPAPAPAAAGCSSPGPRLTVQGTGQASAAPDVLTAVFGFSTTASSSTAALSQNNGEVNQALQALSANGVATSDVQTTGLSLAAQYVYPQGGVPSADRLRGDQHGDGDLARRVDRRRRH